MSCVQHFLTPLLPSIALDRLRSVCERLSGKQRKRLKTRTNSLGTWMSSLKLRRTQDEDEDEEKGKGEVGEEAKHQRMRNRKRRK